MSSPSSSKKRTPSKRVKVSLLNDNQLWTLLNANLQQEGDVLRRPSWCKERVWLALIQKGALERVAGGSQITEMGRVYIDKGRRGVRRWLSS